jgi:hypothetical protein
MLSENKKSSENQENKKREECEIANLVLKIDIKFRNSKKFKKN